MFQSLKINKTCFLSILLGIGFSSASQAIATQGAGIWLSDNMIWIATAHTLYNEYSSEEELAWANGLAQLYTGASITNGFVVTGLKRNINSTRPDGYLFITNPNLDLSFSVMSQDHVAITS